ncbi:hypothetical protein SB748_36480, partial [Rhizobium sp. SIMBA_035]
MSRLIKRASAEARAFKQRKASAYNGSDKLQPPRMKRRPEIDEHDDVPVLEAPRKPRFAPVTFSEERGVRFLHFG